MSFLRLPIAIVTSVDNEDRTQWRTKLFSGGHCTLSGHNFYGDLDYKSGVNASIH